LSDSRCYKIIQKLSKCGLKSEEGKGALKKAQRYQ